MKLIKPSLPDMHPFFTEIKKHPDLESECRTDIYCLPNAFKGNGEIKAILLGADPTNDGIKTNRGLKILDTVFGIGSEFEPFYWGPQNRNLKELGIGKENLYVQNICRNYFIEQTSVNTKWNGIAKIWLKYLKEELEPIDSNIPVLVTAEKIMTLLLEIKTKPEEIYDGKLPKGFFSQSLERDVYALYRHPSYSLSIKPEYCKFLKSKIL